MRWPSASALRSTMFASTNARPTPTAGAIGFSTFVMVTLGVMLGRGLGALVGKRAELAGGVVLIGIGCAILYQHLR